MDYQPEGQIPVAQASYTLTKEEYQKGRLLVEKRHASLLSAPVFILLGLALFALGVTSFFYEQLSVSSILLAAVLMVLGIFTSAYFASAKPANIMGEADRQYNGSILLKSPKKVTICRDVFSIQDEFEQVRPFYSEQRACMETDDFFLIVADRSGKAYLIPKRVFGEQAEQVSGVLSAAFGNRYRRTK